MNYLSSFLKGLAMGVGAIAPGVSGGALAVIFGLYNRITDFIAHINKNFKENIIFFIPVGIGAVVGVLIFSKIIEYLFQNHEIEVRYAFVGLMLGTLPSVFDEANKKGYKQVYLIPFIISFTVTLVITYLENNSVNIIREVGVSPTHFIIYGFIVGFGTIIPGVSASIILMYIGAYEVVISAISNLHIDFLFFLGIGFVLSILLFAKLITIFFDKAYGLTYYIILGLVLGSIVSIFPGFEMSTYYLMNSLLLLSCCIFTYAITRIAIYKQ